MYIKDGWTITNQAIEVTNKDKTKKYIKNNLIKIDNDKLFITADKIYDVNGIESKIYTIVNHNNTNYIEKTVDNIKTLYTTDLKLTTNKADKIKLIWTKYKISIIAGAA